MGGIIVRVGGISILFRRGVEPYDIGAKGSLVFYSKSKNEDYKVFCPYSLDHKNCTFGKRGVRNLLSKEIQACILAQAEGEYSPGEFTKTTH